MTHTTVYSIFLSYNDRSCNTTESLPSKYPHLSQPHLQSDPYSQAFSLTTASKCTPQTTSFFSFSTLLTIVSKELLKLLNPYELLDKQDQLREDSSRDSPVSTRLHK